MSWLNFFSCCTSRDKEGHDIIPKQNMNNDSYSYLDVQRKNNNPDNFLSGNDSQSKINHSSTTDLIISQEQHFQVDFNTDQYFNLDKQPDNRRKSVDQQIEFEVSMEESFQQDRVDQNISVFNESSIQNNGGMSMIKKENHNQMQPRERKKRNVRLWSEKEDEELKKYYKTFSGNWEKIAGSLPGRNISQCSQRWRRMNPTNGKQKWTPQEDMRVIALVQQYGRNWGQIAREHAGRSGKQIRERYLNKLDPTLVIQKWSPEEDNHIFEMYQKWGSRWSKIAAELKGRSENQVKNRFYTYIKRVKLGEKNKYQIVYNQKNQGIKKEEIRNDDESCGSSADSSSSSIPMDKLGTILNDNDNMIQEEQ